jgi:hypothetical protein
MNKKTLLLLLAAITYIVGTIHYFPNDIKVANPWLIHGHLIILLLSLGYVFKNKRIIPKENPAQNRLKPNYTKIIVWILIVFSSFLWTSFLLGLAGVEPRW